MLPTPESVVANNILIDDAVGRGAIIVSSQTGITWLSTVPSAPSPIIWTNYNIIKIMIIVAAFLLAPRRPEYQ
jgi:hypothetical protein